MAIDSKGRIIVAGMASVPDGRMALARYTPSGELDTSFSNNGKLTTSFTNFQEVAWAVAVEANDRIVVAGRASV